MNLSSLAQNFKNANIYHSETDIAGHPTTVAYEKKFRWSWMATQLNTFIVVTDLENEEVTAGKHQTQLKYAYEFASQNNTGWPKGLQSGLAVIGVILSSEVDQSSIDYCEKLLSGKKWSAFTVPVVVNTSTGQVHAFTKNPMWGRIYYPHFKKLIQTLIK